jgi:hypothetical protein
MFASNLRWRKGNNYLCKILHFTIEKITVCAKKVENGWKWLHFDSEMGGFCVVFRWLLGGICDRGWKFFGKC